MACVLGVRMPAKQARGVSVSTTTATVSVLGTQQRGQNDPALLRLLPVLQSLVPDGLWDYLVIEV